MPFALSSAAAPASGRRLRSPLASRLAVGVGVVLALNADPACAAALGSLVTSVGLFTALAAVFLTKGWPAQLPASAVSAAAGAIVIAGGAFWLWRHRIAGRMMGFAREPRCEPGVASFGRASTARALSLPEAFDHDTLLGELRLHFVRVQEAWDVGATATLQTLVTPEMLDELRLGLPAFASEGTTAGRTEVVTLCADLFAFEVIGGSFLASVEFSGLMRESCREGAQPFRELWMLTRSIDGKDGGWRLARHQTLL